MPLTFPTNRQIKDADSTLVANIACPNANATTLGAAIDLGQPNAHPLNEKVDIAVVCPAVANLANTKTITFTLEHADVNLNANFAAVTGVGTVVVTATSNPGSAAATTYLRVPGATKRFIRLSATANANAGTTITETATLELRF